MAVLQYKDPVTGQLKDLPLINQGVKEAPIDGKQYARKDGEWSEIEVDSNVDLSDYTTKEELNNALLGKVDKQEGKQLTTEDFTTVLKEKLDSLSNYNDTEIKNAIDSLESAFNTLVEGNATAAIDTFNEIVAFLKNVENSQDLDSIIAGINTTISKVEAKIPDTNNFLSKDGGTMNNTNLIGNLNADMLDGLHIDEFLIKGPRVYSREDFDTKYRFASMYSTDYISPIDGVYNYGQVLSFVDNCSTTQFYCPDNTGLIYFRNKWGTDSYGSENFANVPWYEIITSKNIRSQTVANSYALRENTIIFGKESIDAFLISGEMKFTTFRNYPEIGFKDNDGLILGISYSQNEYGIQLAFDDAKSGTMKIRGKEYSWGDWKTIAFTDGTIASANKLSATRYIWGQPFDGSGDVVGDLFLTKTALSDNNYEAGKLFFGGANSTNHGVYLSATKSDTYGRKRFGIFTTNAASDTPQWVEAFSITPNGKVGINTTAPQEALEVNGNIKLSGNIHFKAGEQLDHYGNLRLAATSGNWGIFNSSGSKLFTVIHSNGYVGIGVAEPEYTLDVNGSSIFRNNVYVKNGHHIIMNAGNEGVYYTSEGLYWHNTNNEFARRLIRFSNNGNASFTGSINMDGSDQINGGWGGLALNYNCSKYVDTSIWNGQANEIMRVFGESRQVAIGSRAIESPRGRLNVDGDVNFENARFVTTSGLTDGDHAYSHAIYGGYHGIDVCEFYENKFEFKSNGGNINLLQLTTDYASFYGAVYSSRSSFVGVWGNKERLRLVRDGEFNTWLQAGTDTTKDNGCLYMSGIYGTLLHQFNVFATTSNFKGSIIAEGDVTAYSDIRLKNKIESVSNVLDTINNLDVFRYTWKDREDKSIHIGVSAQQVQTIYPEFVLTSNTGDDTDYLTVNYAALATCIAIQGIKELVKKGDERDERIHSLEMEVKILKERIKTLEVCL